MNHRLPAFPRLLLGLAAIFISAGSPNAALTSLFDGKTLDGWDYDPAIWRVSDGVITGGSGSEKIKKNFFISTKKSYANFDLRLKIKCSGDPKTGLINSGIQIRSARLANGGVAGYQIDCGKGWFGKIYDEHRRRLIYPKPIDEAALLAGIDTYGWNEYRIRAIGPRIQVWINGIPASDYTETNPRIPLNGIIAPQIHSGGHVLIQIKDITLQEFPPTHNAPTWKSLGGVEKALALVKAPRPTKTKKNNPKEIPVPPKGAGRINFDFESGDTQGWTLTEGWFAHLVANNTQTRNGKRPMNKEGTYYLGTLEGDAQGTSSDRQTGVVESPVFRLTNPQIQLAVSGGSHNDTYVALCTLDGKEVRKASGNNSELFTAKKWTVPELVGKPVFVRLVDRNQGGWGHIVLDAFSAQGELLPAETKKRHALAKPKKPTSPPAKAKKNPGKKTQSARTTAQSAQEQLAGFTVPPGFVIELVASEAHGVINPIDLAFDDSGRLWTQTAQMYPLDPISGMKWKDFLNLMEDKKTQAEHPEFKRIHDLYRLKTKGKDKILILDDPTQPATAPLHVWADGLSIPQSILPFKDGAYVCHGSELFLLRDTNGDGTSDKMEPVLSGFAFADTHTMSHLLVRGPGSYIHFTQGALNKGLVTAVASGKQHEVNAACQVRFQLDHQDFEVLSSGPSNMWGMQLRADGQWYGTEANDRAYSIIPWEHGTAVTGAAFHPMRPYQPKLPDLHKFRVGGTGISALEFSDDAKGSFPGKWKDVALLGNAITSTINAVRVVRNADGTVTAEHLPDFLSSKDDWFRPVNLEFGPDGCLYVADFYNKIISHNEVTTDHPDRDHAHGRIWRIRHESQPAGSIPDVAKATPAQLLTHLHSPTLWEKRAAWHQIADRKLTKLAPQLVTLASTETADTVTRIHALWCLEELGHFDAPLLDALLASKDDAIRREAVRSLASFKIPPSAVAQRLTGHIEDANPMVRSQAIRTLSDLRQSDPAVIALLIHACKPALPGNALGGSYERTFERFLARMALEKFPAELKAYLQESAGKHAPENILWAIQALDETSKQQAFVGIWRKASGAALDSETFIAITGMLSNPAVENAVKPTFDDPQKAADLVSLALANQSRVQSPKLIEMLTPAVTRLLSQKPTQALALNAISAFKIETLAKPVAAIRPPKGDEAMQRLLLSALAVNPEQNKARFIALAKNSAAPFDFRIEAVQAIPAAHRAEAIRITQTLLADDDATKKAQVASLYSQSKSGATLLAELLKSKTLSAADFDLSAAERLLKANPKNPQARTVIATTNKKMADQKKAAQSRIHKLTAFVQKNPGDPIKGKTTFVTCLACHQVGSEGQTIAPPLDGSGHRELEHLLTALVDPDAAVEGGYGLYRITRTDGQTIEGYLDKKEALGTTLAVMGGTRIFVPQAEIKSASFVGGRSFMPSAFGQLPAEVLADLVAYIQTLKQATPPAATPTPTSPKTTSNTATDRPNFVVIFTDDQGYGDLSCFGAKHVHTPRIDRMAAEGMRLTSFYVAAPVCTPSRAALMTGCYPSRVDMATGSNFGVLLAGDKKGLNPSEITIAEVLKGAGYKTGMFGKWHLGDQPEFLPTRQGFDEYFGIPYSHDIHPFHPSKKWNFPPLPLLEGEKVVELDPDADYLTQRFTDRAVSFIEKHKDDPFFLYLPHPIPHKPLHISPPFMEEVPKVIKDRLAKEIPGKTVDYKSRDKMFRQAIAEIDGSVGQILDALKRNGIDDKTFVIFTSDNGPAIGSAGKLKGRKGSNFEGGMREPTVIRWPGHLPAGKTSDRLVTAMDLLPTFAHLADAKVPTDRIIDGRNIWSVLTEDAPTPHEAFFYHRQKELTAVRAGKWKMHLANGKPSALYNLDTDISESKNVIKANPEIVTRLSNHIADFQKDIAANVRPAAFVEKPVPLAP